MKTIVICVDGTWNRPGQRDRDPVTDEECVAETNVLRVFRFLTGIWHRGDREVPHGRTEPLDARSASSGGLALYLSGVGSAGRRLAKLWEGATGTGTSERIMQAYQFLAEFHEPGDRVFGFGFSRGAFAVRSLAGFLQFAGLPRSATKLSEAEVQQIYSTYRGREGLVESPYKEREVDVDFLGLWDTVGALAFGAPIARWHMISPRNVRRVAHALALDERRSQFEPEFWHQSSPAMMVEEVWFSGVHSNVGGGYGDEGLSNIALAWVMSKAVEAGLPADKAYINGWYFENSKGQARNSFEEFMRPLGPLHPFIVGSAARNVLPNQRIHTTVCERIRLQKDPEYLPAARLDGGKAWPKAAELFPKGRMVETPDYLGP